MKKTIGAISWGAVAIAVGLGCAKPAEQSPVPPSTTQTAQNDQIPPNPALPDSMPKDPNAPTSQQQALQRKLQEMKPKVDAKMGPDMLPQAKGTDGYAASATKPEQTASEFEASFHKFTGIEAEMTTTCEYAGGHGKNVSIAAFRNPSTFRIQYVTFTTKPVPGIQKETIVANGTQVAHLDSGETLTQTMPIQAFDSSKVSLSDWPTEFPRAIFSALGTGHPILDLVRNAEAAGLDVTTEDRTVPAGQKMVSQRRLLISRKPADVATKGKFDIEIVADKRILVPYTIRIAIEPPDKSPLRIMWSAKWLNERTFPDVAFKFPPKAGKSV